RGGEHRTLASASEAEEVGLPPKRRKPRSAQRHAEVHCLLQLPSLQQAKGCEMLIVELADIGPGFRWAEPCSRGCMQLLMKHGIAQASWTDGRGGVESRSLNYAPELDVPSITFAGTSRMMDDAISERACADVDAKLEREASGAPAWTSEELVEQGAAAAVEAKRREPLALRGQVFPLPRRKGPTRSSL
ncbi:unnamed protein product, partial [Polarella glacialis]